MRNAQVAQVLSEISELLELSGESHFRIAAYQKAAEAINEYAGDIWELYQTSDLQDIPGVGKGLASKIEEILLSGSCKDLENIKERFPEGLRKMLLIPVVGPKTAKMVFEQFGISTPEEQAA